MSHTTPTQPLREPFVDPSQDPSDEGPRREIRRAHEGPTKDPSSTIEPTTNSTQSAVGAISAAEQAQGLSTCHISGNTYDSREDNQEAKQIERIRQGYKRLYDKDYEPSQQQYDRVVYAHSRLTSGGTKQGEFVGVLEVYTEGQKARFVSDAGVLALDTGEFIGNDKYDELAKEERAANKGESGVRELASAAVDRSGTVIAGRSARARKRMLDEIAELKIRKIDLKDVTFITLTLPDAYYGDNRAVKTSLDNFRREFTERYPDLLTYWSMEEKIRDSGTRQGEPVVHFHLITLGWLAEYERRSHLRTSTVRKEFRTWVSAAWTRCVVAQVDGLTMKGVKDHLAAGTRTESPRGVRNALAYIAKYIGKDDAEEIEIYYATHPEETHWTGRTWGKWNHKKELDEGITLLQKYTSAVVKYVVHSMNIDRVMGYFRWKAGIDAIEERLGVKLRLDRLSILIDPDELIAWCERRGVGLADLDSILGMDPA